MNIHCIGNSHLNTFSFSGFNNFQWSDNPLFKFCWLGPVIAYNFYEHHLIKVKEYLPTIKKEEDYILLVVGEVDCRIHLPQQADTQKKPDEDIVKECVERVSRVYQELKEYKLIVFGTHPTTTEPHNMEKFDRPIYGSCERRNNICVLWNKYLKQYSEKNNLPFLSIYDDLVDNNNMSKMEYFRDYCHLDSNKVKPFLQREFKKIGINL